MVRHETWHFRHFVSRHHSMVVSMISKLPGERISSNRSSGKSGDTSARSAGCRTNSLHYTFGTGNESYIHIFKTINKIDIFKNMWSHKTSQTFKHISTYNLIDLLHSPLPRLFSGINLASPTASKWHSTSTWGNEHGR